MNKLKIAHRDNYQATAVEHVNSSLSISRELVLSTPTLIQRGLGIPVKRYFLLTTLWFHGRCEIHPLLHHNDAKVDNEGVSELWERWFEKGDTKTSYVGLVYYVLQSFNFCLPMM